MTTRTVLAGVATALLALAPLHTQSTPAAPPAAAPPPTPAPSPSPAPAPSSAPGAAGAPTTPADAPKNLEVLPRDWTRAQVIEVMRGWTGSLGVRCQHCHVGEEGKPLSEFDFASDAKPTKQRAREMLLMLEEVNRRLAAMPSLHDGAPVTASCYTCHRGMPRPRRIEDVFAETIAARGLDAAIAEYRELRGRGLESGGYDFSVRPLARVAQARLETGDAAAAVKVLDLARELGYDSVAVRMLAADAARAAGDATAARGHLEKALELAKSPAEREAVEEKLRELSGAPAPPG